MLRDRLHDSLTMSNSTSMLDGARQDVYSLCRNLSNSTNGTRTMTSSAKAAGDTDFGAVLYIVVVLTFYSFGIVIMIVKYLKTEKKEMEEEMVLDSFFKGIPDKRIQTEKEAVNRVAIQAFHTLTASKQSRGFPPPSHNDNQERRPIPTQNKTHLSPSQYRRERYSIQPMYIETSRQLDDDENSDSDDNGDNYDDDAKTRSDRHKSLDRRKVKRCSFENISELEPLAQHPVTSDQRPESKQYKSVLFSDAITSSENENGNKAVHSDVKRANHKSHKHQNPMPSIKHYSADVSIENGCGATPRIQLPVPLLTAYDAGSDTETNHLKASKLKTRRTAAFLARDNNGDNSNNNSNESASPPLKSLPSKKTNPAGKGFVSARKPPKGIVRIQDSPDLGYPGGAMRMSSLDKISGDGSSYDSSSSLLTRIHLADTFTPPSRPKSLQNKDSSSDKSRFGSGGGTCCLGGDVKETINEVVSPSSEKLFGSREKSNEKLKLTAGTVLSMQPPSYDSTSSSKGLTTRINIVDNGSKGGDGGNGSCLVTDL